MATSNSNPIYTTLTDVTTFRDLTICRSEEVYADRGMLEVDPVTNVPRANLAPL